MRLLSRPFLFCQLVVGLLPKRLTELLFSAFAPDIFRTRLVHNGPYLQDRDSSRARPSRQEDYQDQLCGAASGNLLHLPRAYQNARLAISDSVLLKAWLTFFARCSS